MFGVGVGGFYSIGDDPGAQAVADPGQVPWVALLV